MLLKNELNLTTVSRLAGILTKENKQELLDEVRFKSTRRVEALVARYSHAVLSRIVCVQFSYRHFSDAPVAKKESEMGSQEERAARETSHSYEDE